MNKFVLLGLLGLAAVVCANDSQPDNSQLPQGNAAGYEQQPLPQSPPEPTEPKNDYSNLRAIRHSGYGRRNDYDDDRRGHGYGHGHGHGHGHGWGGWGDWNDWDDWFDWGFPWFGHDHHHDGRYFDDVFDGPTFDDNRLWWYRSPWALPRHHNRHHHHGGHRHHNPY